MDSSADAEDEALPGRSWQQMRRRLSPEEVEQLVAGYRGGLSLKALGEQFDVHADTVGKHLLRVGEPRRQLGLPPHLRKEVAQLYQIGLSLKALGEQFGVDGKTIAHNLTLEGVKLRARGRPPNGRSP